MIKIFLGYDPRESVAFHVASHSILRHASAPVSITPLVLSQLPLTRRIEGSTEFAFSRFLVPWLCGYQGRAIYADCDILVREDIGQLMRRPDMTFSAVWVVKHKYQPKSSIKMDGQPQIPYDRKNWSSVMVFDCSRCQMLTPHLVDTMPGLWLHQFKWLPDSEIGELDPAWNFLVGEQEGDYGKLLHYTQGGPWFKECESCDYAEEWKAELSAMNQKD